MSTDTEKLFEDAQDEGLSKSASLVLVENLNALTIAGAQGATIDEIAGDEVTITCVVLDETGSMTSNHQAVVDAYNEMVKYLKESKSADDIILGTWMFNEMSRLHHDYLLLDNAPELGKSDYNPDYSTALFDAALDALTGVIAYSQTLRNSGIRTKVVVVVFTDGGDNISRHTARDVRVVTDSLIDQEYYTLALVAFGGSFARQVAAEMGFPNVLEVGSTASEIRRAMGTVSKSVVRASQTKIDPNASKSFFN